MYSKTSWSFAQSARAHEGVLPQSDVVGRHEFLERGARPYEAARVRHRPELGCLNGAAKRLRSTGFEPLGSGGERTHLHARARLHLEARMRAGTIQKMRGVAERVGELEEPSFGVGAHRELAQGLGAVAQRTEIERHHRGLYGRLVIVAHGVLDRVAHYHAGISSARERWT